MPQWLRQLYTLLQHQRPRTRNGLILSHPHRLVQLSPRVLGMSDKKPKIQRLVLSRQHPLARRLQPSAINARPGRYLDGARQILDAVHHRRGSVHVVRSPDVHPALILECSQKLDDALRLRSVSLDALDRSPSLLRLNGTQQDQPPHAFRQFERHGTIDRQGLGASRPFVPLHYQIHLLPRLLMFHVQLEQFHARCVERVGIEPSAGIGLGCDLD
mmetsp:Transcript_7315/g.13300  ORF Transcript_7315/g.13300 Transcript_7315/m.13300 type:complete len:215 (+) Transcript_7315:210-854(+)